MVLYRHTSKGLIPFLILFVPELRISGNCSGSYSNSTTTYIKSPNYPENYDDNVDCRWWITTTVQKTIVLNLTEVMVENCCDMLQIYEGDNDSGKQIYQSKDSSGSSEKWVNAKSLYVKFTTDDSTNFKGFKILLLTFGKCIT